MTAAQGPVATQATPIDDANRRRRYSLAHSQPLKISANDSVSSRKRRRAK